MTRTGKKMDWVDWLFVWFLAGLLAVLIGGGLMRLCSVETRFHDRLVRQGYSEEEAWVLMARYGELMEGEGALQQ